MSLFFYLNENHSVRPCTCEEWAKQLESIDWHIDEETVGDHYISTIWLGNNHSYFGGPPLIFETMIFRVDYSECFNTPEEANVAYLKAKWEMNAPR